MTTMGGRGVRAGLSLHSSTLRGEVLSRTPRVIPPPWRGLRPPAPQHERPCDVPPVTGGIPQHLSRQVTWATQRCGCLSPGTLGSARLGSCSSTICDLSATGRMYGPLGPWGDAPGERVAPAGALHGRSARALSAAPRATGARSLLLADGAESPQGRGGMIRAWRPPEG
jgi:hypothetical protein